MPLYEYRCTSCGYSFEKIQNFSAKPETECPKCQGVLIRPVTAPALRFEGAGWYVNDYAGKGGAKSGEAAAADPAKSSDSTTGSKDAKPANTESSPTPAVAVAQSKPAPATPAPAAPSTSN